jgi:hypothetical protein
MRLMKFRIRSQFFASPNRKISSSEKEILGYIVNEVLQVWLEFLDSFGARCHFYSPGKRNHHIRVGIRDENRRSVAQILRGEVSTRTSREEAIELYI